MSIQTAIKQSLNKENLAGIYGALPEQLHSD